MRNLRHIRTLLAATTALAAISGTALAADPVNTIKIDVSGDGKVKTLTINQDTAHGFGNTISGDNTAGTGGTRLPIRGAWDSVSITQNNLLAATNTLYGSIKTSTTASPTGTFSATYAGGNNAHSLNIGASAAPANPSVTISVTNTVPATTANTITDALNGTALTYNLTVNGTENTIANTVTGGAVAITALNVQGSTNSVTNTLTTSGAINLSQAITGSSNTISNTVGNTAASTSFDQTLTVTGSGNAIANTAPNVGAKTINQSILSDNNTLAANLTGTGTQSLTLSGNSGSRLDFLLTGSGNNTSANLTFTDVIGASSAAAKATVIQSANNTSATLTVTGTGFTAGTGATGGTGVYVSQSTAGAVLNTTYVATGNGYSASYIQ